MFQGDRREFPAASSKEVEKPAFDFAQFLADSENDGAGFNGKSEIEKLENLIQMAEQYAKDQLDDPEVKLQSDPRWEEMSKAVKKLYRMQGKEWHPESKNLVGLMLELSTHYSPGEAVVKAVRKGWQLGGPSKRGTGESREDDGREDKIVQFMKGIEQAKAELARMKQEEKNGSRVKSPTNVEVLNSEASIESGEGSREVDPEPSAERRGIFESRKKTLEWLMSERKKEVESLIEKVTQGSLIEEDVVETFEQDQMPEDLIKIIYVSLAELHNTGLSNLPPAGEKFKMILESKLYPVRKSAAPAPHEGFTPFEPNARNKEYSNRMRGREWILREKSDAIDDLIHTVLEGNPQELDVRRVFQDSPQVEDIYIAAITDSLVELRQSHKEARNPRQIFESLLLKNLEPVETSEELNNQ